MLALLVSSCCALSGYEALMGVNLTLCAFVNGMHQGSSVQESGDLVHAVAVRMSVSRLSLFAEQKSSQSLFRCYCTELSIQDCFFKNLRSQFGSFSDSNVRIESSGFSSGVRPLLFRDVEDETSERIDMWQSSETLSCRNVTFENLRAPGAQSAGAIRYTSWYNFGNVLINNCTFRNCQSGPEASAPNAAAVFVQSPGTHQFNDCNVLDFSDNADSIILFQASTAPLLALPKMTMSGNVFKDIELVNGGSGMVVWSPDGISYVQCEFVSCVSNGVGGSCVRLRPNPAQEMTISFEECNFSIATSENGNGGAIRIWYQQNTQNQPQIVSITGCTFEQCGTKAGYGGSLCVDAEGTPSLKDVIITNTTVFSSYAEQGGSISVLAAITGKFEVVNCSFTDGKASNGNGGFLRIKSCTGQVILQDTTFLNGSASGDGGCMYLENDNPSEVLVENCTIDSCEATTGTYSIVLKCPTTTIDCLHMKNMLNGKGRLQLSTSGFTDGSLSLTNCEFENFETQKLFDYGGSLSALVLSCCSFDNVVVSEQNLFQLTTEWKNLTFDNCAFENIVSLWSLVRYYNDGAAEVCVIDNSTFRNITVDPKGTEYESSYEVILDLRTFEAVTLRSSKFLDINKMMNGIVNIEGETTEISLEFVLFSGCVVDRPDGAQEPKYPILNLKGVLQKFVECQFISCSYAKSGIVSVTGTVSAPISNCVFDGCSCNASNLFKITHDSESHVTFEQCSFQSMSLSSPVVGFNSVNHWLKFVDTSFLSLAMPDTNTLHTVKGYDIENITVSDCSFEWFTSSSATITGSRFSSNTIKSAMFYVESGRAQSLEISECNITSCNEEYVLKIDRSGDGSKLNLSMCRFKDCSANSPNLLNISFDGDFRLENCSFDDCSCDSGSLILVEKGESIYVGGCCFRGTASIDGVAAYINSTLSNAEFELPLCFDLDESHSVYFNGSRPWSEVSSEYQIFECSHCVNFPVITSTFTASLKFTPSETFTPGETFTEVIPETMSPTSSEDQGGSGLSPGAVAGIVVGVLAIVAGVVVFLLLFLLRRNKQTDNSSGVTEMSDETVESATVTSAAETASEWNGQVTEEAALTQLTTVDDFMQPFEEAIDY